MWAVDILLFTMPVGHHPVPFGSYGRAVIGRSSAFEAALKIEFEVAGLIEVSTWKRKFFMAVTRVKWVNKFWRDQDDKFLLGVFDVLVCEEIPNKRQVANTGNLVRISSKIRLNQACDRQSLSFPQLNACREIS